MNPKVTEVIDKIESATIRERALVLLSCVAVVYLLWDFVVYTPLANENNTLNKTLLEKKNSIETLKQEEKALMLALSNDPDKEVRILLGSMKDRKQALEDNLEELSGGLVPVERLSLILQDVLKKTDSLSLESLKTLPVEKLQIDQDKQSASAKKEINKRENDEFAENGDKKEGIYKHGVSLVVKGTYFQVIDYLHRLEDMPARFYWEELLYEQDDYPNGYFHLKVYTLTKDEGLSGV